MGINAVEVVRELKKQAPFTALGTLSGVLLMTLMWIMLVPSGISVRLFWILHPAPVLLSAFITAAICRLNSRGEFLRTMAGPQARSYGRNRDVRFDCEIHSGKE